MTKDFRHTIWQSRRNLSPGITNMNLSGIAACGGNARNAVKALIVANEFLEAEVHQLQAAVSNGYARGKFEPVPRDRKDSYD